MAMGSVPPDVSYIVNEVQELLRDAECETDLEGIYRSTQSRTLAALKNFETDRWDEPSPDTVPRDRFPTLGSIWEHLAFHNVWHLGHIAASVPRLSRTALGLTAPNV